MSRRGGLGVAARPKLVRVSEARLREALDNAYIGELDGPERQRLVDEAVTMMKLGYETTAQAVKGQRRALRREKVRSFLLDALVVGMIVAALAGVGFGFYLIVTANDADYAGYGAEQRSEAREGGS